MAHDTIDQDGGGDLSVAVDPQRDHIRGSVDASVTLLQYGDYECPYTRRSNGVVKELAERLGDRLRFVYRNFPLRAIHHHAEQAAEAAEAANAQGKFWEMHDWLFEHQKALEDSDLRSYAASVGLDAGQFGQALIDHTFAPRVQEDLMSGVASGVQGTPTFFINGVRHDDSYELDTLLAAIERVG